MLRCKQAVLLTSALVLVAVAGLHSAPQASRSARDNNPDVIEIRHYRLSMDEIEKMAAATDAVTARPLKQTKDKLLAALRKKRPHHT